MTLIQIWKENPDQIRQKRVDQIISFAGDGRLSDNSTASKEFRDFLARVPGEFLTKYVDDCLKHRVGDSFV